MKCLGKAKRETVTKVREEIRHKQKRPNRKNFQGHKRRRKEDLLKAKMVPVNLTRRREIEDQIQIERNSE